jgi:hypothetical protein
MRCVRPGERRLGGPPPGPGRAIRVGPPPGPALPPGEAARGAARSRGELDTRADPSGETRVWLALEALQVTGSFKVRGALVALEANRGRGHVVAASAGNHGAAVSYAGSVLGVPATVCVPRTAPRAKRDRIAQYGAELVVAASDNYDDAEALAKELAVSRGAAFVSPYDDVDVVLGNGVSLGFEIVRALAGLPERLLVPFGGGGLATGLAWALQADGGDRLGAQRLGRPERGILRDGHVPRARGRRRAPGDGGHDARRGPGGGHLGRRIRARSRGGGRGGRGHRGADRGGHGARSSGNGPGARGERRDGARPGALRPPGGAARG